MIPLDRADKWIAQLDTAARTYLSPDEHRAYAAIPAGERSAQVQALLEQPIAHFSSIIDVLFRARWAEVLQAADARPGLTLLEIASGDTDVIPQMMARDYPGSRYIAANMNRRLTAGLRAKTSGLPLDVVVIEEDAIGLERHLAADSVDVVAFQHGVNDVLQAILCDKAGVDTIETDWMETLPKMIAIMQHETRAGTLERNVKPEFLALLTTLLKVMRPGGLMAMNHYMFQLDLDWGYPPDIWEHLIPIVREWVRALPGVREASCAGFDPQWWLFLKKA